MPDRTQVKTGDRIRPLRVPHGDLEQRELREGAEDAGWTAGTIMRIIAQDPVVTFSSIDKYGYRWFESELKSAIGEIEYHSLAITEDEWRCMAEASRLASSAYRNRAKPPLLSRPGSILRRRTQVCGRNLLAVCCSL